MTRRRSASFDAEIATAQRRKRRVYLLGGATAVGVLVLSWAIREPGDAFIAVVYPATAAYLLLCLVALWRRWLSLPVLEAAMLAPVTAVTLGRLAWHVSAPGPIDDRLLVLVGGHYWALATLVVAGFVLLDRRAGVWFGLSIIGASVLLLAAGAGSELTGPDASTQALAYLVRVHAFLLLILVLAAGVGALRSQLHRALIRAEAYADLARTDPLTGLLNRRAGMDVLRHEADARHRYGRPVAVTALDIDRFKAINDAYGHQRGDEVLVEVARVLRNEARDVDHVARWGGEEFLVISPETTAEQAAHFAERCRSALAATELTGIRVTASFGVTELHDDEGVDDLLARADALLYHAKDAGRDRVLDGTDVA